MCLRSQASSLAPTLTALALAMVPGTRAFVARVLDTAAEMSALAPKAPSVVATPAPAKPLTAKQDPKAAPLSTPARSDSPPARMPAAKRVCRSLHVPVKRPPSSPRAPAPAPASPHQDGPVAPAQDNVDPDDADSGMKSIEQLLRQKQQQLMLRSDNDDPAAAVIQAAFEDGVTAEAAINFFNGIKHDKKQCSLMSWYVMIAGLLQQHGHGSAEHAFTLAMELYENGNLDDVGKQLCLRALLYSGRNAKLPEEELLGLLDDLSEAMPENAVGLYNFALTSLTKAGQCPEFFCACHFYRGWVHGWLLPAHECTCM
eukprot:COSAG05_NODE_1772_length_4112_cov_1.452529_4_plen_314_part_00